MRAAARDAVAAVATVADPLERAVAYHHGVKAVNDLLTALVTARRSAVIEARDTQPVEQIATALGERRTKVYQIANGVARS